MRKAIPVALIDPRTAKGMSKDTLRARAEAEPKGCSADLRRPESMTDPIAIREWDRVTKAAKQLTPPALNDLDIALLECYCMSIAQQDHLAQIMAEEGQYLPNGKPHPALKQWRQQVELMLELSKELCISEIMSAAHRITRRKEQEATDPFAEYFKKYGR